ncbi:MAG: helix-turn-helix domain-containing protein [Aurantimonas endophytica]|uniref:Putative transcriptional regulator n=1 Tax=Aurantimonas endophytica TaxID=1522175 RepID=A0A7W6MNW1_9HYPH|nr:helix-turn-helix domain-containing protein [Aurantimonas endophytica]MBB4002284.1 putative transcriptional regulator [Aurantimonas endophytica]MCO6402092.1 helix-turn-helix domain-containing protein [Aurantimonas endophytica]
MKRLKTPEQEAEDLVESLEQALQFFEGDETNVVVHRIPIAVPDIAKLRRKLKLTQDAFAGKIGVPVATLRNWEQGRRYPTGPARVLLNALEREPKAVMAAIAASETVEAAE